MAVLFTDQFFDYPMYFVEVILNDGGNGNCYAFWVSSFSPAALAWNQPYVAPSSNPDTSMLTASPGTVTPLLSAIQSWAEGYDWGEGNTYTSITVTKYTETSTDATP